MKSDFYSFLRHEKEITDQALKAVFVSEIVDAQKLARRFKEIVKLTSNQVQRGGKRARPLLVRLAYRLSGGKKSEAIIKASLFVELIHSFLLIHDDIADRDQLRHGDLTVEGAVGQWFKTEFGFENEHFSKTLAMLCGDYLYSLAHQVLAETEFEAQRKIDTVRKMAVTISQTFAGWQLHYWQNFESVDTVKEAEFLRGMELVSAKYSFEAPLMIGLILAGSEKKLTPPLKKYAYHTGMAFQITDDILGLFADSRDTGKPVANDIREGKKTLLVLRAIKLAPTKEKEFLKNCLGKEISLTDLLKVRQIVTTTGSLEYSRKLASLHVVQGRKALTAISAVDTEAIQRLRQLSDFVINRKY